MAVFSLGERKVAFHGDEWFIAHNATVIGTVILRNQASVWFNAVVRGDNDTITIGERTNIQDAAVLHVDPGIPLTLGRDVSVGHKAMLHGCTIGDGTLVPEGKTYPDGVLVVGSPGKVVRELKAEEKEEVLKNAEIYVRRAMLYREKLKPQER